MEDLQHGKEEEERNSEDSTDHRRKDDVDAAAEGPGINNHGESMYQRDGGYEEAEEETVGVLEVKEVEVEVEVVGGSEGASAPLLAHHPCSLLQLLLRACAGCLGLSGYDDPKPAADDDDDAAAPAVAETPQEGEGGGDKAASYLYLQEVGTRVRRPSPPGRPREGPGGDGGKHN